MTSVDLGDIQIKAKHIHVRACEYLRHFTDSVQRVFSVAPSAHDTIQATNNKMALLLTLSKSEIERHAVSFSAAEAVAIYEPNKAQLGSILPNLFHDCVVVYVFFIVGLYHGIDSIALSFAKKYGHYSWLQLSRLDLVDFIATKRRTKMLCCAHIHKTSQPRMKHIGLSVDIPREDLLTNLCFVCHIMGTVGLLPPDALTPFLRLGMVLRQTKTSDLPIKGITPVRTTVSHSLSWEDYRSVDSGLIDSLMRAVEELYQVAEKGKNPSELQVFITSPVFFGANSGPRAFIDAPFPRDEFTNKAPIVHQVLKQMEVPHAFHKYGLRMYTSPIRSQVVNHALHEKQISLKDANLDGAYWRRDFVNADDEEGVSCTLSSRLTRISDLLPPQ